MIETQGLSKYFGDFAAVEDVDLRVQAGEVLVLLGPNGAGKTTTVRMLTSILRPTRGWARVAGHDVVREARDVRASVGVLTEQHALYNRMRADEYLRFYGSLYGLDNRRSRDRAGELLGLFGLLEARKKRLGEYSKGMRQKLALVRALIHEPPVLLLDEPTSAMDPESAATVREAIRSLRSSERAIILCTHNLSEAEALADQVAIIRKGRIILAGPIEALKRKVLGPPEYDAILSGDAPEKLPPLPEGVTLIDRQPGRLRFRIERPEEANPRLIEILVQAGAKLTAFPEAPRSLEMVYMEAMYRGDDVG